MNPGETALLCMDLQNDIVDPNGARGKGGNAQFVAQRNVLANVRRAQDAAREAGIVVAHVRVGYREDYADAIAVSPRFEGMKKVKGAILGTWGCEFPETVTPRPDEVVFTKQGVNPFFNSGLLTWLLHRGVCEVVLCGVSTNMVVEASARYCDDAGLRETVLEDGCASNKQEWHEFSVTQILPMLGRVISVDDFTRELRQ